MNCSYRLLLGVFASLALSACVFTVDHEEILGADVGHPDAFSDADADPDTGDVDPDTGDADPDTGDADPDPSITLSLTVTYGGSDVEDQDLIKLTDLDQELSLAFDCDTVPEEADCTIECALTTDGDDPTDGDWTDRCDTIPLLFEQDLSTHYRAHQTDDDAVATDPEVHTTRVRFAFELTAGTLPTEEIYYADQGQISPHCTSPILQGEGDDENFDYDCTFESCTWASEADGDSTNHCEDGSFDFDLDDESDTLTVVVCSTDFDDHCETIEITYTLVQPEWTSVSAGHTHTCGILADHSLWCWGSADEGQSGPDQSDDFRAPNHIQGDWLQVATGNAHTCAINTNDELFCWGRNLEGQVDPANTGGTLDIPNQIAGEWKEVSAGRRHNCAITKDSELICWGLSGNGQLGNGTETNGLYSVPLPPDTQEWKSVSAGDRHSCAIATTADDSEPAYCWGLQEYGRLGNGNTSENNQPEPQRVNTFVNAVLAGISAGGSHSCGRISQNPGDPTDIYCWGQNTDEQLGSSSPTQTGNPQSVPDTEDYKTVSTGGSHTCAIDDADFLHCWGLNASGQLGTDDSTAVNFPDPTPIDSVSTGDHHTCAITLMERKLFCWGTADNGRLGFSSNEDAFIPMAVEWSHGFPEDE